MEITRAHKDAALLKLLGYDPSTHAVQPVVRGGSWRGVRVVHVSGTAKRFVPEARMNQLGPKWSRLAVQIAEASTRLKADTAKRDRRRRIVGAVTVAAATAAACVGATLL